MFQINRVPIAISDLIGGRSWPVNPDKMLDTLQLGYDARQEFIGARALVQSQGSSFGGMQTYTAVPTLQQAIGELWFIHSAVLYLAPAPAGCSYRATLGLGFQPSGTPLMWLAGESKQVNATERGTLSIQANQWIPPVAQGMAAGIYLQVENFVGVGPVSYTAALLYTPVKM